MKKFILALTFISGINFSIESSYSAYFSKGATAASLLLTTAAGTMAGSLLNDSKVNQLSIQVDELVKNNNILTGQLSSLVGQLSSSTQKEGSFLDRFGKIGLVLSALFTGYRYAQYGLSELQGFYQILSAVNLITNSVKNKASQDEASQELSEEQQFENSNHRLGNMTPAQRAEFLKKHTLRS